MDAYTATVYNTLHKVALQKLAISNYCDFFMSQFCVGRELGLDLARKQQQQRGRDRAEKSLISPTNHNSSSHKPKSKWRKKNVKRRQSNIYKSQPDVSREESRNNSMSNQHLQLDTTTSTHSNSTAPTHTSALSSTSSFSNSAAVTLSSLKHNRKRPRTFDQEDEDSSHPQTKRHQLSSNLSPKITRERLTPKDTWTVGAKNQNVIPKWSFDADRGLHPQDEKNQGFQKQPEGHKNLAESQQAGGKSYQTQWKSPKYTQNDDSFSSDYTESRGYWSQGKWYQSKRPGSGYSLNVSGQGSSIFGRYKPAVGQPYHCLRPMQLEEAVLRTELDQISSGIWNLYFRNRQTMNEFHHKIKIRDSIHSILGREFYSCGVYIVGSSLNGFASKYSDADLCLTIYGRNEVPKGEAIRILRDVKSILNKAKVIRRPQLIQAKVPILKFFCKKSGVECDLNINNLIGIRNTFLLQVYSKIDWRMTPLMITIKKWARSSNINDASQGTLSSYSLTLMLIHYLQVCSPPVLPCLQAAHPQIFSSNTDVRTLFPCNSLNQDLPDFLKFHSENEETLADLLTGFFQYFAFKFKFSETVISVRTGSSYPRKSMNSSLLKYIDWEGKFIYIEEPFDGSNTARAVYQIDNFWFIFDAFVSAANTCQNSSQPLNSLITEPD